MAPELGRQERGSLRRFRAIDRALLLVGIPLWACLVGLSIQSFVGGIGYPPIGIPVFQAGDEYPPLEVLAPIVSFEDSALRVGDQLIRVGPFDLRGVDSLTFFLRFVEAAGSAGFVEVEYERAGKRAVTTSPAMVLRRMAPVVLLLAPAFLAMAVLLLFASPRSELTRRLFHAGLFIALSMVVYFGGAPWKTRLALVSMGVLQMLAPVFIVRFLMIFPSGVSSRSPWARVGAVAGALVGFSSFVMVVGFPISMNVGVKILPLFYALVLIVTLVHLTRTYRRADPLERRQMKWVLFGLYAAALPPSLAFGWIGLAGGDMGYALLSQVSLVMIPVAFYIAIARTNLFDIDRLISATMSFNVLAVGVIGVALLLAPRVASAASDILGIDPGTGQLAASALIAALAVPLQNSLRPRIEGLFFRERHALDVGIGQLLTELAGCTEPATLARSTGEGLMRLVKPENCALYGREEGCYVPLFAAGAAVPPALEADTPLVATLGQASGPLVFDERTAPDSHLRLDAFGRAVLETLGAHVVVPITRRDDLALILCIGPKRSGDVYTPTDVALLTSLTHAVSQSLQRFDEEMLGAETRRLQESLRRYVPGAVAEVIDEGEELEATTREVSVLFVDLRGYTALSESREAEEIFAAINRYTEVVSSCVRDHGGTVVEFNGDGMMAVFGAPRPMEQKESAALAAATDVLREVPLLPGPEGETGGMRAAVGIATGPAFVGNIRAADRLIWTAIGNTTNLAARMEGLTRELDADIAIDEATHERVGSRGRAFTAHPDTRIRGRSGAFTIYSMRA